MSLLWRCGCVVCLGVLVDEKCQNGQHARENKPRHKGSKHCGNEKYVKWIKNNNNVLSQENTNNTFAQKQETTLENFKISVANNLTILNTSNDDCKTKSTIEKQLRYICETLKKLKCGTCDTTGDCPSKTKMIRNNICWRKIIQAQK